MQQLRRNRNKWKFKDTKEAYLTLCLQSLTKTQSGHVPDTQLTQPSQRVQCGVCLRYIKKKDLERQSDMFIGFSEPFVLKG